MFKKYHVSETLSATQWLARERVVAKRFDTFEDVADLVMTAWDEAPPTLAAPSHYAACLLQILASLLSTKQLKPGMAYHITIHHAVLNTVTVDAELLAHVLHRIWGEAMDGLGQGKCALAVKIADSSGTLSAHLFCLDPVLATRDILLEVTKTLMALDPCQHTKGRPLQHVQRPLDQPTVRRRFKSQGGRKPTSPARLGIVGV